MSGRGSLAGQAGLESGMVIIQANRKPVPTVEDLRKILEQQSLEKGVLLLVQSAEGSRFVVIRVEGRKRLGRNRGGRCGLSARATLVGIVPGRASPRRIM